MGSAEGKIGKYLDIREDDSPRKASHVIRKRYKCECACGWSGARYVSFRCNLSVDADYLAKLTPQALLSLVVGKISEAPCVRCKKVSAVFTKEVV